MSKSFDTSHPDLRSPKIPETRPPSLTLRWPLSSQVSDGIPITTVNAPVSLQFNLTLHLTQLPNPPWSQTLPHTPSMLLTRVAIWSDTGMDGKALANLVEREFGSHELPRQRYVTISRHFVGPPRLTQYNPIITPHDRYLGTRERGSRGRGNLEQSQSPDSLDPSTTQRLDGPRPICLGLVLSG